MPGDGAAAGPRRLSVTHRERKRASPVPPVLALLTPRRREVRQRDYYPLGDESFTGSLLKVRELGEPLPSVEHTLDSRKILTV